MRMSSAAPRGAALLLLASLAGGCAQLPPAVPAEPVDLFRPGERHPEAPAELEQFGRLAGRWHCLISNLQPDGSWKPRSGAARWSFSYTLGGYAVSDVWEPEPDPDYPGSVGMNLRVFDPLSGTWRIAWATVDQARFDLFEARYENGDIIMWGDRPDHKTRVTFYQVRERQFDWKYEFSAVDDGTLWTEVVRMHCEREGPDGEDGGGPEVPAAGQQP